MRYFISGDFFFGSGAGAGVGGAGFNPQYQDKRTGEIGERMTSADLVFRALRPGDPEIARSQAVFRYYDPMVVRESVVKYSPGMTGNTAHP